MTLTVLECVPEDAGTLAAIHLSTITPFMKYMHGDASIDELRDFDARRYAVLLKRMQAGIVDSTYLKVVDDEIKDDAGEPTIIACAEWGLPGAETMDFDSGAIREELPHPPKGLAEAFVRCAEFYLEDMSIEALKGRDCYALNHITTLPSHQRRGAAKLLVAWGTDRADKDGSVCFLMTELGNSAMRLYEKMGFEKVNEGSIPLSECGLGPGTNTHFSMIREPKNKDGEGPKVEAADVE